MKPESQKKEDTKLIDEETVQLVVAHLGDQDFGAPISQVREVIRYTNITAIPDSPEFIAGIASFHGEMALIVDLKRYFSLSSGFNKAAKHIIVIRREKELFGLLVDEVTQIIRVPQSQIKSTAGLLHHISSNYISGVYTENENRLIMVFDLDKILSKTSISKLEKLKAKKTTMGDS